MSARGEWQRWGLGAALAGLASGIPLPAAAQDPLPAPHMPPVFRALEGAWRGSGELFGRPAAFSMTWELRQDGVAILHFSNAFADADGEPTPVLDATAVYRAGGDSIRGVWIDSRPQRVELTAVAEPSTLTTHWRSASESGRTEYQVLQDGTAEVADYVRTDEGWRAFGSATYERARRPGGP